MGVFSLNSLGFKLNQDRRRHGPERHGRRSMPALRMPSFSTKLTANWWLTCRQLAPLCSMNRNLPKTPAAMLADEERP